MGLVGVGVSVRVCGEHVRGEQGQQPEQLGLRLVEQPALLPEAQRRPGRARARARLGLGLGLGLRLELRLGLRLGLVLGLRLRLELRLGLRLGLVLGLR